MGRIIKVAFGTESQTFGTESAPKVFRKPNRIIKLAFGTESLCFRQLPKASKGACFRKISLSFLMTSVANFQGTLKICRTFLENKANKKIIRIKLIFQIKPALSATCDKLEKG